MGTNLARAYAPARKAMARGVGAVQAVFDGVWLGLLDPADLAEVDEAFYLSHGRDAATYESSAHNLKGLEGWEERIVQERFRPGGRVVVTSAGGGREVLALAERGFDVAGYEPNAALVEAGRRLIAERGATASLETSARDGFPEAAGECDAVVVGWGSYIHIQGRDRRVALLRSAHERLETGGVLVVSFWERPPGERRYWRTVRAVASAVRRVGGRPPAELGDTMRDTFVHVFAPAEVRDELAEAGFEVAELHSQPYPHAVAVAS